MTSFRVQTEAIGGGAAGREETVIKSSLPFSMAVKLPVEVSEGDRIAAAADFVKRTRSGAAG